MTRDNKPDGLGDVEDFEGHDEPFDDADDPLDDVDTEGDIVVLDFEDEDDA